MKKKDDFKSVEILVDKNNNLAIFPKGKVLNTQETSNVKFLPSVFQYEVSMPYSVKELAKKIEYAFNDWCVYDAFCDRKKTYEENYYEIKGFKNAMKGKKLISMGWNDIEGKYISLLLPCKTGYSYITIKEIKLSDNANSFDYAKSVVDLINADLNEFSAYKTYKNMLNI